MNEIVVDVAQGVAVLTLHRPERRNAFTGRMGQELGEAYRRCDADDDIRAVVVTGTPPAFCAGADLSGGADTFARRSDETFSAAGVTPPAWEVRKPVIAAINGHAIRIGLTLALQCDIRLVALEGTYGIVQVRRGVMPDAYSHWTLPRLAGLAAAADVMLTGRTFDGREAVELGLASRCLPADEVLPAALEIAHDIARNVAPLSAALTKKLLWQSMDLTAGEVGRLETAHHHQLMGRADAKEVPSPSSSDGRRGGSCGSARNGPTRRRPRCVWERDPPDDAAPATPATWAPKTDSSTPSSAIRSTTLPALTELAKRVPGRILASGAALAEAGAEAMILRPGHADPHVHRVGWIRHLRGPTDMRSRSAVTRARGPLCLPREREASDTGSPGTGDWPGPALTPDRRLC